jgi:hypothetical protein
LQHCLQIERRSTDDLEHVGGGGLLLERLAQFAKKAGVLDGDNRLCSKGSHQRDLLFAEGAHFATPYGDDPNQFLLA